MRRAALKCSFEHAVRRVKMKSAQHAAFRKLCYTLRRLLPDCNLNSLYIQQWTHNMHQDDPEGTQEEDQPNKPPPSMYSSMYSKVLDTPSASVRPNPPPSHPKTVPPSTTTSRIQTTHASASAVRLLRQFCGRRSGTTTLHALYIWNAASLFCVASRKKPPTPNTRVKISCTKTRCEV